MPAGLLDVYRRIDKAIWADDDDAPECRVCASAFTLMRRRHHCRCCGNIFCGECCALRAFYDLNLRMCLECAIMMRRECCN